VRDRILSEIASGALAPARVTAAQEQMKAEWRKEHRRLLYVALTRARDRLVVCGFENRHGTKDGSWYALAADAAKALIKRILQTEPERRPTIDDMLADDFFQARAPAHRATPRHTARDLSCSA
jgi:ATP-dependent exoDNAse (exonuclease V) beta subunit